MGGVLSGSSVLITVKIKIAAAPISHLGDIYGTLSSHSKFLHRLLPRPMISTEELSQFIDPLYAMPVEPERGEYFSKAGALGPKLSAAAWRKAPLIVGLVREAVR